MRTRLLIVVAPIVLISWTASSMTKMTINNDGILSVFGDRRGGWLDRQLRVWLDVLVSLLASSVWLGSRVANLSPANRLNVTMTELPAHAARQPGRQA